MYNIATNYIFRLKQNPVHIILYDEQLEKNGFVNYFHLLIGSYNFKRFCTTLKTESFLIFVKQKLQINLQQTQLTNLSDLLSSEIAQPCWLKGFLSFSVFFQRSNHLEMMSFAVVDFRFWPSNNTQCSAILSEV
jgi:hypothetical protein